MATVPRLSDRMRRPEPISSMPALLRAMAEIDSPQLQSLLGDEVRLATADVTAAGRFQLRGHYNTGCAVPWGMFHRDLVATGGVGSGGAAVTSTRIDPSASLRPFSLAAQAGLRVVTVPNGSGVPSMPNISTPPVAGWVATEGGTLPTSEPAFGLANIEPKRLGFTFSVSLRLLRQAGPMFDALIMAEVGEAFGRGLDAAVLAGSGSSGQPQGLATMAGVNAQAGASLAHSGLLAMRKNAINGGASEGRLHWIGTPTVQEVLGARERSTGGGRFLWDDSTVLGRPAHAAAQAAAGTLVCGDFQLVTLYLFDGLEVVIDKRPLATGGRVTYNCSLYADVSAARPGAFSVASSVT
jgi:HK97 family phage major capsid protein